MDIAGFKAIVRSIIMSNGREATEQEFRRVYGEMMGESFNNVLKKFNLGFFELMSRIPDVVRISRQFDGSIYIQYVSTQGTKHLDNFTMKPQKKKSSR